MISYFNHLSLKNPTVQQLIIDTCGVDILSKLINCNKFNIAHSPMYSRKGINTQPFKNQSMNVSGIAMPDYNPDYNVSWDEITDQCCVNLRNTHFDRPWTVLWSGGIDSTVIVSAIIKNLAPADFDNITIVCTSSSIWENPHFYFDYIKPNFKVGNSVELVTNEFDSQNTYTIDGTYADQLFGCLGGYLDTLYQNWDLLHTDIIKNKDAAIDFIVSLTDDKKFAEWYYHALVTNADSVGVPITTIYDMMWWSGFSFAWTSIRFGILNWGKWKHLKNGKNCVDRHMRWYNNDNYQQWAMNPSNVHDKLGANTSELKLAAKKYIYSLDNNNHYFKFKTKMPSIDMLDRHWPNGWCCMDDNWNLLNLTDHRDQIISMLPDHLA